MLCKSNDFQVIYTYDNTAQIRLPSTSPGQFLEKDEHNSYVL